MWREKRRNCCQSQIRILNGHEMSLNYYKYCIYISNIVISIIFNVIIIHFHICDVLLILSEHIHKCRQAAGGS